MIHFGCVAEHEIQQCGTKPHRALGLPSINDLFQRDSFTRPRHKTNSKSSAAFRYGTANSQFETQFESQVESSPPCGSGEIQWLACSRSPIRGCICSSVSTRPGPPFLNSHSTAR